MPNKKELEEALTSVEKTIEDLNAINKDVDVIRADGEIVALDIQKKHADDIVEAINNHTKLQKENKALLELVGEMAEYGDLFDDAIGVACSYELFWGSTRAKLKELVTKSKTLIEQDKENIDE